MRIHFLSAGYPKEEWDWLMTEEMWKGKEMHSKTLAHSIVLQAICMYPLVLIHCLSNFISLPRPIPPNWGNAACLISLKLSHQQDLAQAYPLWRPSRLIQLYISLLSLTLSENIFKICFMNNFLVHPIGMHIVLDKQQQLVKNHIIKVNMAFLVN